MAIKIFIDQGHNPSGPNTGAEGFGLKEQDITYQVGKDLAALLRADERFEVRLSRNTPEERLGTSNATSLAARVRAANAWPADYFVSIHANANTDPAINGTEVYVYRKYTQSYYLAQHILNAVVNIVGTKDNGVRANPSLYVLRRTNMPAILVELAYLTMQGMQGSLRPCSRNSQEVFMKGCSAILAWTSNWSIKMGKIKIWQ